MSFWRKEEIPVDFFFKSIHINFHKHMEEQVTPTSFKIGQNIWTYPVVTLLLLLLLLRRSSRVRLYATP